MAIFAARHCIGDLAALLRREGLYSSHLATATPVYPQAKRVAELERQLVKATARAERAPALPRRDGGHA